MKNKKEIRKEILNIRSSLLKETVYAFSREICRNVRKAEAYKKAQSLCLYMPVRNEVDVSYLIKAAGEDGKSIWLPRVEHGSMDFYRYKEGMKLSEGAFGIPEPENGEKLTPEEGTTLVIMPGAVFSGKRDRIGYGGGYYDRFLEKNPVCRTIAVCYDFQIISELPAEKHDIKPDMIVSESRIIE